MTYRQGELLPRIHQPSNEYLVVSALASELPNALPKNILFTGVGKVKSQSQKKGEKLVKGSTIILKLS